jgi:hypothetical protein
MADEEKKEITLASSELFHTPGIIKYAQCAFMGGDRVQAMDMLILGYGLPEAVAEGILDLSITTRVEGDKVIVEVPSGMIPEGWDPTATTAARQAAIKVADAEAKARREAEAQAKPESNHNATLATVYEIAEEHGWNDSQTLLHVITWFNECHDRRMIHSLLDYLDKIDD